MSEVLRELAERLESDSIDAMDAGRQHLAERLTDDMETLRLAADVLDTIPGDDKLRTVEWAIRIAAELMAEWEEGSTHADTYYIVEAWWRSCPPEVRAQITQGELT